MTPADLQAQWDAIENKPQVALYAGGGVFGVWLLATIVGAINQVPLVSVCCVPLPSTYACACECMCTY